MEKFNELNELFAKFVKNRWLFPTGTWSDTHLIDENFSFRIYFNDNRDYASVSVKENEIEKEAIYRKGKWEVTLELGEVSEIATWVGYLKKVLNYFKREPDEEKTKKLLKMRELKNKIKELQKELLLIKQEGKK